jgi:hypothetical protein
MRIIAMYRRRAALITIAPLILAACTNLTPAQQQAAITLAVQQGATLATALGGPNAAKWVANGGLICRVGNSYVAAIGLNVQGTKAADMQAACNGLDGSGTALPPGVDPASVLVAVIQSAKK